MINNLEPIGILDIGAYETKFLIFKIDNSTIEIISYAKLPTQGIKKGIVSDLDKLSECISKVIGGAEDLAKIQIKKIYLAISSLNNSVVSFCYSKNIGGYEIEMEKDIQFLINGGVNLFREFNKNLNIIHLFNLNLRIDKINSVDNPVGLVADTLEGDLLIVSCKKNICKNYQKIIDKSYVNLEKFVYPPYALSFLSYLESPLSDNIMTIDFGHEKTSISVFKNDNFIFTSTIPLGSWHITNDISKSLNLNMNIAEKLKVNNSSCSLLNEGHPYEYLESDNLGIKSYKKVSNNILNKLVISRVEEIIDHINLELISFKSNKETFNKILITGEGSKIHGFTELLKNKLKVKCMLLEKFTPKIKNNIPDAYDVCLSVINFIKNSYKKEIPSFSKRKKSFFETLYSFFN